MLQTIVLLGCFVVQSGTLDSLEEDVVVVSEVVSAEVELSVLEDPGC